MGGGAFSGRPLLGPYVERYSTCRVSRSRRESLAEGR